MSGHVETIPVPLGPDRHEPAGRPGPAAPEMPREMWDVAEPGAPPVELGIAAAILLVLVLLSPLL